MTAISLLLRRRKRRSFEQQRSQNRLTSSMIAFGLTLAMLVIGLIFSTALTYALITNNLPALSIIPSLLDPEHGSLLQPTRIYDRTGQHVLLTLASDDAPRTYLTLDPNRPDHIPEILVRATIALADPQFWNHPGFIPGDITTVENPLSRTLAQQLVSDLLLWNEPPSFWRTTRERILASQLTARFGREKILEWYLNSANYGHFAYGADAAAKLYLGKPLVEINLAEAALLASVNQSPAINPIDAPEAALQRQKEALDLIVSRGFASAAEADQARAFKLTFIPESQPQNIAPELTSLALAQLENRFNLARAEQGGMQVLTTLDYDLQLRANCALQTQFARLNNAEASSQQPCEGAADLPPLPSGQNDLQSASAVVLDPRTGQLLALIGDSMRASDSASFSLHRPGTLLTPFIYLTGFTRGLSLASLVWDLPPDNTQPAPNDHPYQGPLRIRTALTNDSLAIAAQIFNQMGAGLVQQTMASFGLDIHAANLQALLNHENRYSILQIAQSYGVFAAQGTLIGQPSLDGPSPSAILLVRDLDGHVYADWDITASEQIVSAQLAYMLTDGLSANLADMGRPVALKTGLTLDNTETWAVGYTPHRVVTVWIGGKDLSSRPVLGLWKAIMQSASLGVPPDNWALPSGMLRMKVCDPSGMLPSDACPNIVDEIFIDGYQPMQIDTLYRVYAINRETGLLATIFTPEQLVEKKVYMFVPPEAQAWAKTAGLPVPPTQYDNIQPPPPNPDANINVPRMFAKLQGQVMITGTAAGTDFSYYRLQYGQGLNPESWIQIGSDIGTPVKTGKLTTWDTTGLKGLYSLQLLVVHSDHSLQTATVQVSVNNP